MKDPLLVVSDVRVSFLKEHQKRLFGRERQQVLRGVSLALEEGECLGVIGESGSGKSTLGRVLAGLLPPESGAVFINGRNLYGRGKRDAAGLRHGLSVVFQDYTSSVNPRFRVEHAIGESLRALERLEGRVVDKKRRVAELLEQVGLPASCASRYPHELSGGQLQRVCIARAIAVNPRVVLLDEAVSSLDASTQTQVMDLLMELRARRGLSYIFITHDLTCVTYFCDRALFFNAGRIVEQVDDMKNLSRVRDPYARRLLDAVMGIGVQPGDLRRERADLLPAGDGDVMGAAS